MFRFEKRRFFCCDDCKKGLSNLPKVLGKIDELEVLKEKFSVNVSNENDQITIEIKLIEEIDERNVGKNLILYNIEENEAMVSDERGKKI